MIPTCRCRACAGSCTNTGLAWSRGSRLLPARFVITRAAGLARTEPFFPVLMQCRCSLAEQFRSPDEVRGIPPSPRLDSAEPVLSAVEGLHPGYLAPIYHLFYA